MKVIKRKKEIKKFTLSELMNGIRIARFYEVERFLTYEQEKELCKEKIASLYSDDKLFIEVIAICKYLYGKKPATDDVSNEF